MNIQRIVLNHDKMVYDFTFVLPDFALNPPGGYMVAIYFRKK